MSEIKVENVSLEYPIFGVGKRNFKQTLLSISTGGLIQGSKDTLTIKALNNLNLHFTKGDRVGILGHNGAGKTSLLKALAGIYIPQKGKITVTGKVSALFSPKLGIDQESTGYENIRIRGVILGMTERQIAEHIDEIAEFTDLGDFLNMPVRTYSSGMATRLAFAVVTAIEPDILVVDEGIGAGDKQFLKKAKARLQALYDKTNILVMSSHNVNIVRELCNRVVVLEHGQVKIQGGLEVLDDFEELKKDFKQIEAASSTYDGGDDSGDDE